MILVYTYNIIRFGEQYRLYVLGNTLYVLAFILYARSSMISQQRFYAFDQGGPKFEIAFSFRFTFTHFCQCFYNNVIQQLTLTIPPRPSHPSSPGPALPMLYLRLVGLQNRGSAAVQPMPPLRCAVVVATAALCSIRR